MIAYSMGLTPADSPTTPPRSKKRKNHSPDQVVSPIKYVYRRPTVHTVVSRDLVVRLADVVKFSHMFILSALFWIADVNRDWLDMNLKSNQDDILFQSQISLAPAVVAVAQSIGLFIMTKFMWTDINDFQRHLAATWMLVYNMFMSCEKVCPSDTIRFSPVIRSYHRIQELELEILKSVDFHIYCRRVRFDTSQCELFLQKPCRNWDETSVLDPAQIYDELRDSMHYERYQIRELQESYDIRITILQYLGTDESLLSAWMSGFLSRYETHTETLSFPITTTVDTELDEFDKSLNCFLQSNTLNTTS